MEKPFIGNAFQLTSGTYNSEIIPVPELSSYLTSTLFLVDCYAIFTYVRKTKRSASKLLFFH